MIYTVGFIATLQFVLNALALVVPRLWMVFLWSTLGIVVGSGTIVTEMIKARRRGWELP